MLQADRMLGTQLVRAICVLFVRSQIHRVHRDVKKRGVGLLGVAELHQFTCTGNI